MILWSSFCIAERCGYSAGIRKHSKALFSVDIAVVMGIIALLVINRARAHVTASRIQKVEALIKLAKICLIAELILVSLTACIGFLFTTKDQVKAQVFNGL